ncbi:hypothetical protein Tco_1510631, partial [Tanacetum coccineum]
MSSAMSSQLGYRHKNHQYKLHLLYKEYETMEEAMTHLPKGIEVSDWVKLCERFASESFQSRREGKEVLEIDQYKMAHFSKKIKGMINKKATTIWLRHSIA